MAKSQDKKSTGTALKNEKAKTTTPKDVKKTVAAPKTQKTTKSPSKKAPAAKRKSTSAFAKATFEDKMSQAIKESIAKRKASSRTYDPLIISRLKEIISNYTESPELLENIENNTDENFLLQLNIDSVDFVEIIVDAEEAFQIKLEDDKIKKMRSFDDLYDLIVSQIKESKESKESKPKK